MHNRQQITTPFSAEEERLWKDFKKKFMQEEDNDKAISMLMQYLKEKEMQLQDEDSGQRRKELLTDIFFELCSKGCIDKAKSMISKKVVDSNAISRQGVTPLYAVAQGLVPSEKKSIEEFFFECSYRLGEPLFKMLLEQGANPNAIVELNNEKSTVLHLLAKNGCGHLYARAARLIGVLKSYRVDLTIRDASNHTVLAHCSSKAMAEWLVQQGVPLDWSSLMVGAGLNSDCLVAKLTNEKKDLSQLRIAGEKTLLHLLILILDRIKDNGNVLRASEMAKVFLDAGVDPMIKDDIGYLAQDYTRFTNSQFPWAQFFEEERIERKRLKKRCDERESIKLQMFTILQGNTQKSEVSNPFSLLPQEIIMLLLVFLPNRKKLLGSSAALKLSEIESYEKKKNDYANKIAGYMNTRQQVLLNMKENEDRHFLVLDQELRDYICHGEKDPLTEDPLDLIQRKYLHSKATRRFEQIVAEIKKDLIRRLKNVLSMEDEKEKEREGSAGDAISELEYQFNRLHLAAVFQEMLKPVLKELKALVYSYVEDSFNVDIHQIALNLIPTFKANDQALIDRYMTKLLDLLNHVPTKIHYLLLIRLIKGKSNDLVMLIVDFLNRAESNNPIDVLFYVTIALAVGNYSIAKELLDSILDDDENNEQFTALFDFIAFTIFISEPRIVENKALANQALSLLLRHEKLQLKEYPNQIRKFFIYALKEDSIAIIDSLIVSCPDMVAMPDEAASIGSGYSALYYAAHFGREEIFTVLKEKLHPEKMIDADFRHSPLYGAVSGDQEKMVSSLLASGHDGAWLTNIIEQACDAYCAYPKAYALWHIHGSAGEHRADSLKANNQNKSFLDVMKYLHMHLTRAESHGLYFWRAVGGNLFNHSLDTYLLRKISEDKLLTDWLLANEQAPKAAIMLADETGRIAFRERIVAGLHFRINAIEPQKSFGISEKAAFHSTFFIIDG